MDQEVQDLSTPSTANSGTLTCEDHDHGSLEKGIFTGKMAVGHNGSDCNYSCVYTNGKFYHIECQSFGSVCSVNQKLTLKSVGDGTYFATTLNADEITALDFFSVPDRSMYVGLDEKNREIWINIPAQVSYKDKETKQLTYKEVFITDQQFYPNN